MFSLILYLQVNQKMMKSTHIKDLYGEIERLKAGNKDISLLICIVNFKF